MTLEEPEMTLQRIEMTAEGAEKVLQVEPLDHTRKLKDNPVHD